MTEGYLCRVLNDLLGIWFHLNLDFTIPIGCLWDTSLYVINSREKQDVLAEEKKKKTTAGSSGWISARYMLRVIWEFVLENKIDSALPRESLVRAMRVCRN